MVDTSNALAVIPPSGVDTYRMSTDAAGLCREIVTATAQKIQGKRYVKVEGWQAIAVAHGCAASARAVEVVEGGIRAIGEVRRMDTGAVIAEAEGFVGDDEPMWAKRPMYARRAMAQTRAVSRACRSAFAHVVVMIDASLMTTPAEEMPWDDPGNATPENGEPAALQRVAPGDRHLVQGDGRSTYEIKHAEKPPGRLAAELLASNAVTLCKMPGASLLAFKEWKAEKCTPKGTKTNGDRLAELREKHPDLAQKVDEAVDLLPVAA